MTKEGRDPRAQLVTARLLLAQFDAQLDEYDAMNREARRGTPRGRDLTARLDGLRTGRGTWAARVMELEQIIERLDRAMAAPEQQNSAQEES